MIKQIILISVVAIFAYYAGANGLTVTKVMDWLNEREITHTVEDLYKKTIEIAEQKTIANKSNDLIDSF